MPRTLFHKIGSDWDGHSVHESGAELRQPRASSDIRLSRRSLGKGLEVAGQGTKVNESVPFQSERYHDLAQATNHANRQNVRQSSSSRLERFHRRPTPPLIWDGLDGNSDIQDSDYDRSPILDAFPKVEDEMFSNHRYSDSSQLEIPLEASHLKATGTPSMADTESTVSDQGYQRERSPLDIFFSEVAKAKSQDNELRLPSRAFLRDTSIPSVNKRYGVQPGAQGQQDSPTPQRSYSGYDGPQTDGAASQFPHSAAQQAQSRFTTAGKGQTSGRPPPYHAPPYAQTPGASQGSQPQFSPT